MRRLALFLTLLLVPAAQASDAFVLEPDGHAKEPVPARVWHSDDSTFEIFGGENGWRFRIRNPETGENASLELTAPPDEQLTEGVYDHGVRPISRTLGRPGIELAVDGSSCGDEIGRFEVHEVALDADGRLERFWAVFEYRCGPLARATFGEIRIGDAPELLPAHVRWPAREAGDAGMPNQLVFVAETPTTLGQATITGAQPGAFAILGDGCSGATLAAGERCALHVRYHAAVPGLASATLSLPSGDRTHATRLEGFAFGGHTAIALDGPMLQDWEHLRDPVTSHIAVAGNRQALLVGVDVPLLAWFQPPTDDVLRPRAFTGARREPGMDAGFALEGIHSPCEEAEPVTDFTISELRFFPDGSVRSYSTDFEQRCPDAPVSGSIDFRTGDTTPPPPWMLTGEEPGSGSSAPAGAPEPRGDRPPVTAACRTGRWSTVDPRTGGAGADRLRGTRGRDVLIGRAGADRLVAGRGRDCLVGGRGRDRLVGGPGRDVLRCGPGRDVAVVTRGDRVMGCERRLRRR